MALGELYLQQKVPHAERAVLKKLELSEREFLRKGRRVVRCPQCGYRIIDGTEERYGTVQVKCDKCGFSGPLSLRLFRTQKHEKDVLDGLRKRKNTDYCWSYL